MGTDYNASVAVGFSFTLEELVKPLKLVTPLETGEDEQKFVFRGMMYNAYELSEAIAHAADCTVDDSYHNEMDLEIDAEDPDDINYGELPAYSVVFGCKELDERDIDSEGGYARMYAGGGISLKRLADLAPLLDGVAERLSALGIDMRDRVPGVHVSWSVG